MIKCDYHLHTTNSWDGASSMEEYILKALEFGFEELCFTEHFDVFPYRKNTIVDLEKYQKEFIEMKEKYGHQINLKFGLELGLIPGSYDEIKELISGYNFDFVLGSFHATNYSGYIDPNADKGYTEYLQKMHESVLLFIDLFDVLGHFDFIARYDDYDRHLYYDRHAEIIDKIFLELISRNKGIEINTSGFIYGLGTPHPNYDILKRYKELGGSILTIGSDAHHSGYIGYKFDEIERELKKIGFEYITVYEDRKPKFIKL